MCKNGDFTDIGFQRLIEAGEKATEAITDALWRLMRSRGWGTVVKVERALEMPRKQLHKARARGLRLSEVMAILEVLDHPPGPFFASVFDDGPKSAADRFKAQGAELLARGVGGDLPDLALLRPDAMTDNELGALDRLVHDDPTTAIDQARKLALSAASKGHRGDAAACAARWASALRMAEQWHHAHVVLVWAINHAPKGPTLADCWRRAGSLVSDYGEFDAAAELARLSMVSFIELGDVLETSRSLLYQGVFVRRAGRPREAVRHLRSALVMLPPSDTNYRFIAHLAIGFASVDTGSLSAAEGHAAKAETIGAPSPGMTRLRRLHARISARRGDFDRACRLYEGVVAALANTPAEAALVGCELARVYLDAGRPAEAVETAQGLAALTIPQRANRVIAAAIRDLWRTAAAGRLTLDVLDSIAARVRRGRDRRAAAPAQRPS